MSLDAFKGVYLAAVAKERAKQVEGIAKTKVKADRYIELHAITAAEAESLGIGKEFKAVFPNGGGFHAKGGRSVSFQTLLTTDDVLEGYVKELRKIAKSLPYLELKEYHLTKIDNWPDDIEGFISRTQRGLVDYINKHDSKEPTDRQAQWDDYMKAPTVENIAAMNEPEGPSGMIESPELMAVIKERPYPFPDELAEPAEPESPVNETDVEIEEEEEESAINEGDGEPSETSDGGTPINLEDEPGVEKEEEVSKVESTEPAVEAKVAPVEAPATPAAAPAPAPVTPINDADVTGSADSTVTNTENTISPVAGEISNTPTVLKEGDTYSQGSINEGSSKFSSDKAGDIANIDNSVVNAITNPSVSSSTSDSEIDLNAPLSGDELASLNASLGIDTTDMAENPDKYIIDKSINETSVTEENPTVNNSEENVENSINADNSTSTDVDNSTSDDSVVNESKTDLKSTIVDKSTSFLNKAKDKAKDKIKEVTDVAKGKLGLDKKIAPLNKPEDPPKDEVTATEVKSDKPDSKGSVKEEEKQERKENSKDGTGEEQEESAGGGSGGNVDMSGVEARLRKIENLLSGTLDVKIID